jgi:RimJ/RimL family protein N-acetyltransferase
MMSAAVRHRVILVVYDDMYRNLFLKWFDDPEIRAANEVPDGMTAENMLDALDLCSDAFYVITADGVPVGWVCLAKLVDGFYQVPITIADKAYRGKGVGKSALRLATPPVVGGNRMNYVQKIRPENKAMIVVSDAVGFRPVSVENGFVRMEKRG